LGELSDKGEVKKSAFSRQQPGAAISNQLSAFSAQSPFSNLQRNVLYCA